MLVDGRFRWEGCSHRGQSSTKLYKKSDSHKFRGTMAHDFKKENFKEGKESGRADHDQASADQKACAKTRVTCRREKRAIRKKRGTGGRVDTLEREKCGSLPFGEEMTTSLLRSKANGSSPDRTHSHRYRKNGGCIEERGREKGGRAHDEGAIHSKDKSRHDCASLLKKES